MTRYIVAGREVGRAPGLLKLDGGIRGGDIQASATRHGVPGINDKVENCRLELRGVDPAGPQIRCEFQVERILLTQGAPQEGLGGNQHFIQRHDVQGEGAAAGEGQKLLGEFGRPPCRGIRRLQQPGDLRARQFAASGKRRADHFQAADDDRKQIVEVVRDAACQLTDHFELLRVPQQLLGLAPFGDFEFEPTIRLGQFTGAFRDLMFQHIIQPTQFLFRAPHAQQCLGGRYEFAGLDRFDQKAVGAAVQRYRAIARAGQRRRCLQDDDAGILCLDPLTHLDAVDVGKHDVEQDQVRGIRAAPLDRLCAPCGLDDVVAVPAQDMRLQVSPSIIIIDDEDLGARVVHSAPMRGFCSQNAAEGIDQRVRRQFCLRQYRRGRGEQSPLFRIQHG